MNVTDFWNDMRNYQRRARLVEDKVIGWVILLEFAIY
jgi:hypothetical protein